MDEKRINLLNKFLNGKYIIGKLSTKSENYKYYITSINDLKLLDIVPLNYEDITSKLSNSKYLDIYLSLMKNIKSEMLYKSHGHGINHNIRTSIFTLIISAYEGVSIKDFKLVIEAAKYHDIGRSNDLDDKSHGLISSQKINFLNKKYSKDDMNYLKTIIECHSLDDKFFENVAKRNSIKNIKRCRKLFNILKDSDALDRARLEDPFIKKELLRTKTSIKLIPFAYELFESYENNLEDNK